MTCSASNQAETFLEVVNIGAARLESSVLENFLVQRNVGLDAFDNDLAQGAAHARKRGVVKKLRSTTVALRADREPDWPGLRCLQRRNDDHC